MHKLYKISSHPSLLQVDNFETGPDAKKKLEFAKVALTPDILRELPGGTYWKSDGIMDDHMKLSGKMKTLDYLLRRYLRKRNRVLVFSYSTASLNIIQNHIKVKHIPFLVILLSAISKVTHRNCFRASVPRMDASSSRWTGNVRYRSLRLYPRRSIHLTNLHHCLDSNITKVCI